MPHRFAVRDRRSEACAWREGEAKRLLPEAHRDARATASANGQLAILGHEKIAHARAVEEGAVAAAAVVNANAARLARDLEMTARHEWIGEANIARNARSDGHRRSRSRDLLARLWTGDDDDLGAAKDEMMDLVEARRARRLVSFARALHLSQDRPQRGTQG